jgi:predicted oxidoreductase (fatty acid repression mutant protein)
VGFLYILLMRFSPLPESKRICVADDDYQSNQLLYRDIRSYAVGHGCSADWDDGEIVKEIRTSVFPTYEVKPIVPNQMKGVSLEMYDLSDHGDFQKALAGLDALCQRYNEWIESLQEKAEHIPDRQNFRSTAALPYRCMQEMPEANGKWCWSSENKSNHSQGISIHEPSYAYAAVAL